MLVDPKVNSLVIFNGGGGIVEREIKLQIQPGINEFEIEAVPASFDPNSADIKIEYINPKDVSLEDVFIKLTGRSLSVDTRKVIKEEKKG